MDPDHQINQPVLIVGAGQVGSVLALELAHHGVASLLVERATAPSCYPKMDFINGRSMELLRRLDLIEEIRKNGVPPEYGLNFIWAEGTDEPPLSEWSYPSVTESEYRIQAVNDGSAPLEPYQRLPGSQLEQILRRRAADHPRVELREGTTFVQLEQHSSSVQAELSGPDGVPYHVLARYAVACDGASSAVRTAIGVPMVETAPPTMHRDVYFRSTDPVLRRHGHAFLTITAGGLTLVSHDEDHLWTGTFRVDDRTGDLDPVTTLHLLFGTAFTVDEVLNVTDWEGHLAVAETYRRGDVFLAGDAAHNFYPTGGHGANTGLADAVNLGWKLSAVLGGWGGSALLDSYEAERRPVALFDREMCANLLEVWQRFPQLVAGGAPQAQVTGFLEQDRDQINNEGVHFDYRYDTSPVIWCEDGPAPVWRWHRITPTTWPGARPPSLHMTDGSALFDHFGTEFALVDCTEHGAGHALADRAWERGIPLRHVVIDDVNIRVRWERLLVLIRPDQHVAWRGDTAPEDCDAVLARVLGAAS
ncbi:MAG: FAD-dependent monooxygenase [Pseudonocardia sp.]|nr:FAD-dependent monooxygenase [Pseudonocardia sp.]